MIHTGVDRVEWAYLEWCLDQSRPVFGLVRSAFGYLLLDRKGMSFFRKHQRLGDWGKPGALSRFAVKLSEIRRAGETALRKQAIGRAIPARLQSMLKRHFPHGTLYLNTGHSNLSRRVFTAFKGLNDTKTVVLIHDMIPLDWPDYQRAGTVEQFEKRMRTVSALADAMICNSQQTLDDATRHMHGFGRVPPSVVAHLGIDIPLTKDVTLPDVPSPYVMIVGTIEPRKNHTLLLDIWEAWAKDRENPPPHLVICGNRGWNNDEVFARLDAAKANGLPIIEFNGLGDHEMTGLLKDAKAALFPSFAEGFGLPQAEALSLGVTTICADLGIYREILGDFPVYAAESSAYAWRTEIEKVLRRDSIQPDRADDDLAFYKPPRWETHFNLVLKNFG